MRSHPTAGQATIEYIGAIALVALVFIFAAPAVGAPSIAGAVVREIKHALCIVGGDICTSGRRRARGPGPVPAALGDDAAARARSRPSASSSAASGTLTVTPQSDGSVAGRAHGGRSARARRPAPAAGCRCGPVQVRGGAEGAARARVQAARGWVFPDSATADRFLEHSVSNGFDGDELAVGVAVG